MIHDVHIQEMGHVWTDMGQAIYIKVRTDNYRQLAWSEVCEAFNRNYPGQWAVQFFPPADQVVDDTNIYHLYVLEHAPAGVNICRGAERDKRGTVAGVLRDGREQPFTPAHGPRARPGEGPGGGPWVGLPKRQVRGQSGDGRARAAQ
jgi:hypothetical protein